MVTIRRRQFLALGTFAMTATITTAVTTVGCSAVDPSVGGGPATPPAPPTPSPPLPGSLEAAALETALAGQSSTLTARSGLPSALQDRLGLVIAGHRVHAVALADPRPTQRPTTVTTPPPSAPRTMLPRLATGTDQGVSTLREQLAVASTGYARNATGTVGSTALLWGSLAVSSRMAADAIDPDGAGADPVDAPPSDPPAPLPQVSDIAGAQQLLAQLHAIVWGYRSAMARLTGSANQSALDRAAADLRTRMRERDTLVGWLAGRSATAPVAEPAYAVPVQPTSVGRAGQLIMIMESALLPFAGQWVAACEAGVRAAALAGLMSSGRASVYWGGPPRTWPGWPD